MGQARKTALIPTCWPLDPSSPPKKRNLPEKCVGPGVESGEEHKRRRWQVFPRRGLQVRNFTKVRTHSARSRAPAREPRGAHRVAAVMRISAGKADACLVASLGNDCRLGEALQNLAIFPAVQPSARMVRGVTGVATGAAGTSLSESANSGNFERTSLTILEHRMGAVGKRFVVRADVGFRPIEDISGATGYG